jgi:hypothetical protein
MLHSPVLSRGEVSVSPMEIAWTVVGIAVPAAISLGYTFVGLTPPEFRRARICFIGAAVALGGMEIVWYTQTGYPFVWRVIVATLICLTIGIGLPETLRWVRNREILVIGRPTAPPSAPPEAPPTGPPRSRPPENPNPATPAPASHTQDLERQKRSTIRSELGKLLARNTDISETCQKDERPKGFSCWDEWIRWRDQTKKYISRNMEPSYLARFTATMGTHMEYKSMPSGKFLEGQDSDAVNLLHFTAETLDEFIREFQN